MIIETGPKRDSGVARNRDLCMRRAPMVALAPAKLAGLPSRGECGEGQPRFLKRQLSTMSQWCVRRSSKAVVVLGSPKTLGHCPKARLVVTMIEVRS
jgi:hypothetical protein